MTPYENTGQHPRLLSSYEVIEDFFTNSILWRDIQGILACELEVRRLGLEEGYDDAAGDSEARGEIRHIRQFCGLSVFMLALKKSQLEELAEQNEEENEEQEDV
jgi:hypothetical protein